jgi:hypothetical protein
MVVVMAGPSGCSVPDDVTPQHVVREKAVHDGAADVERGRPAVRQDSHQRSTTEAPARRRDDWLDFDVIRES